MSNSAEHYKIPKSFTLFGHKYKVDMVPGLFEQEDRYGDADECAKLIRIQPEGQVKKSSDDGKKKAVGETVTVTKETVLETYFHEITHIILWSIDEDKLCHNEKFVNLIGKALLEIYLSSEYNDKRK